MAETIRAPGAYPDAPDEGTPPPEPTLEELAAELEAAEAALAEAQAIGDTTLIKRALVALDVAQRAYDEALAEAEGRRIRLPWPYRPIDGRLPSGQLPSGPMPPPEQKKESSSAVWWFVGLLAAGGIGLYWYSQKQQQEQVPQRVRISRRVGG